MTRRAARRARPTITRHARPRRHRARRRSPPGIGFYDHLLGSLAHHGLFDLEIRGRRRPPGRRAPHRRGRRARARRGVRRGPRRPGRDPPLRRRVGADGRVARHGGRRRRRPAVRGHRPAVPRRARRRACRSSSSSMRSRRSPGRPARRSTCAARGRNDHHLAEAAFKALGRALRAACEPDPRRTGVASTKGSLG